MCLPFRVFVLSFRQLLVCFFVFLFFCFSLSLVIFYCFQAARAHKCVYVPRLCLVFATGVDTYAAERGGISPFFSISAPLVSLHVVKMITSNEKQLFINN